MSYQNLPFRELQINRANDRHGELENETAAIAWLFNSLEQHMRNLAKDIVQSGRIYEPPLVAPDNSNYIVFDGNRRVTCLKLLENSRRAPTIELQEFFGELRTEWNGDFPSELQCQVETDRDRIDDILYRRHTGSQSGIGQSTWDDRMKSNFVNRTGKGTTFNCADEIEKILAEAGQLPRQKIPRANMNRLFSSESFRNRAGFTLKGGHFKFTHDRPVVLRALKKIASDLAGRTIVLNDIWDIDGKRGYLDSLDREGILPTVESSLTNITVSETSSKGATDSTGVTKTSRPLPHAHNPGKRNTLIPNYKFDIIWSGRLSRHQAIWEELQFHLRLDGHPNAISVLLRVLLDISVENYIAQTKLSGVSSTDTLAKRVKKVADDLYKQGKINKKYLQIFDKFREYDGLISADTLNRYVHSPNFAPSPEHLRALWDTLSEFMILCLNSASSK